MTQLHRARALLVLAVLAAIAIVAFEFPFGEIFHQRGELASVNAQLAAVRARNASLNADIKALSQRSTIGAIAHEEYGLSARGQRSYVILPAAGSGDANDLAAPTISPQDLVAAPPSAGSPASSSVDGAAGPGFWSRFAARLEFWRWAF